MGEIRISETQSAINNKEKRNYQIDFLKMVMAVFVFFCHAHYFFVPDSPQPLKDRYASYGANGVYIFFIISGFLMIKSLLKNNYDSVNAGKNAVNFVINKFKNIALPFWISSIIYLFMIVVFYIYIALRNEAAVSALQEYLGCQIDSPLDLIIFSIPEFFGITCVGGMAPGCILNGVTWYICNMLFIMIPLAYIAIKKRDFFIYVMAPVLSILLLGVVRESPKISIEGCSTLIQLICAVCGLCFGVVAWTICDRINKMKDTKTLRLWLTFIEIIIYFIFFYVLITKGERNELVFPIRLLVPIAIAITFSNKSYVSALFKYGCIKHLGTVSLYLYLNHFPAILAVRAVFLSKGYLFCVLAASVVTTILCFTNYFIGKIIKRIFHINTI